MVEGLVEFGDWVIVVEDVVMIGGSSVFVIECVCDFGL